MNSNHQPNSSREARHPLWTAYALGQLDAVEARAVEAELGTDDEARRWVEEARRLSGALREAAAQECDRIAPSRGLRAALESRLEERDGEDSGISQAGPELKRRQTMSDVSRSRRTRIWLIAGAATAAAVIAGVFLVPPMFRGRETAQGRVGDVQGIAESAPREDAAQREESERRSRREDRVNSELKFDEKLQSGEPHDRSYDPTDATGPVPVMAGSISRTPASGAPVSGAPFSGPPASAPAAPHPGATPGPHPTSALMLQIPPMGTVPGSRPSPAQPPPPARPAPEPGYVPGHAAALPVYDVESLVPRPELRGLDPQPQPEGVSSPGKQGEATTPGTEQYDAIVENPFLAVVDQPLSTFSIDVDTASYANVRRFLNQGRLPPRDAVRIEEMVNYFRYDYPLPQGDVPFSVNMEVTQCPWSPGHRLLRVGLKGNEVDRSEQGMSNLVFLLDVSGSMSDQNKLPLVKQAMRMLVEQLDENDRVAIVTYAGNSGLHLDSTGGHDRDRILDAIDRLQAGGSTHGSAGIQMAYDQATRYMIKDGINRVLWCTDGDLNVGITRDEQLVKLIEEKRRSGVFLTVMGFGSGNLKDSKLEKLADHGNGIYAYIDGVREARKVLVEQLTGSLITIAKDVKIQIELNPAEVASYRLIGYENRVMAAEDFRDDTKDAGEIGAGHTVTALYELVPARAQDSGDAPASEAADRREGLRYQRAPRPKPAKLTEAASSGELLTLKLRYKEPDAERSRKIEFPLKDQGKRFGEATKDFQFAAAVASFGMLLRGSQHAGQATLSSVEEIAASSLGEDPGGYRAEFLDLVRKARRLSP